MSKLVNLKLEQYKPNWYEAKFELGKNSGLQFTVRKTDNAEHLYDVLNLQIGNQSYHIQASEVVSFGDGSKPKGKGRLGCGDTYKLIVGITPERGGGHIVFGKIGHKAIDYIDVKKYPVTVRMWGYYDIMRSLVVKT